jgi:predicted ABC-type ATPase
VTPEKRPTLAVLAGPNGAGKTTLYATRVAPQLAAPFINADDIQRDELGDRSVEGAYAAARLAAERRDAHLVASESFVTETVFSHPSKLELIHEAKRRGWRVMLFHVGVEGADLSVARVSERVSEGGHPVPEEKIRSRYARNGPLIRQAALLCDVAHVYDNSALNRPPERIISFQAGTLTFAAPRLPGWALEIYRDDLAV